MPNALALSYRAIRALDALIAIWAVAWVAVGIIVAAEVRELSRLSRNVVTTGRAIENVGIALAPLEQFPVIGDGVAPLAEELRQTGAQVQDNARSTRDRIEGLSFLLGLVIGLIPTIPPLGVYLPIRMSWTRDRRSIRRALLRAERESMFSTYLARRAVERMGYHELRRFSEEPWRDFELGNHGPLAEAELARLGLRRDMRP